LEDAPAFERGLWHVACGHIYTNTHTHTPMPSQFTPIRISVSVQGQITHFHAETYPLSCALPL